MIEHRPFNELEGEDHGWLKAKHHFSFADYVDSITMPHSLNGAYWSSRLSGLVGGRQTRIIC